MQYGFDLTELSETISQLERIGANLDSIAEVVLEAGSGPAMEAFKKALPRSTEEKEHAQDNVVVTKTRRARKTKNKFRVIGALDRKFVYLYYIEYGTTKAIAHPFLEKAYRDAQIAASVPMKEAFNKEYEKYMR